MATPSAYNNFIHKDHGTSSRMTYTSTRTTQSSGLSTHSKTLTPFVPTLASKMSPSKPPTTLVAGVIVGGTVLILAILAFVIFWIRRQKRSQLESHQRRLVQPFTNWQPPVAHSKDEIQQTNIWRSEELSHNITTLGTIILSLRLSPAPSILSNVEENTSSSAVTNPPPYTPIRKNTSILLQSRT
ncbi:hypothetical protein BDZ94DRAFT_700817 [Collybia nuda]|uniref:Uncharacterized protein n=1 Tax=Collybia nuda TaxID=64659 RepID=A0A9P5Y7E2_9AGAR|nr:hypothetical protein BDZ94DRAFT_700817 [Collybia nuda]